MLFTDAEVPSWRASGSSGPTLPPASGPDGKGPGTSAERLIRALTHQGNKRLGIEPSPHYLDQVKSDEIERQSWRAFMAIFYRPILPQDFKCLSKAVMSWYRHFGVAVSEHDSQILCSAAIQLFNDGKTDVDDLASGLIEMFPAPDLLKINAPTSQSIH
ncbi:hypothetical protein [Rhizobium aegyptiacum]|nr:hypothetical protein [Rhizobium aegyptiacum]